MEHTKTIPIADGPKLDVVAMHELQSLNELGLLNSGEILVQVEAAWCGTDDDGRWFGGTYGALVITDERVLYLATSMSRRKVQEFVSVLLQDVVSAEADVRKCALRNRPTVLVTRGLADGTTETYPFPLRVKSADRAEQIVTSIRYQQHVLAKRPASPAQDDSDNPD